MKNIRIKAGVITLGLISIVEIIAICNGINGAAFKSYLAISGFVFAGIVGYRFPFTIDKGDK